jgi:hypothetical protein
MTLALWIEYPPEPKELLLVWQAPPSVADRLLWAVGRLRRVGDEARFDYLGGEEFAALNLGRSPENLREAGYSGYPAFDIEKRPPEGFRDRVLEAFLRRLPPATRADFSNYLAHYHMRMTVWRSPFALLAVTEARLPSDGFSLVDPLDASAYCVDFVFEIAGFRRTEGENAEIKIGDSLALEPEPSDECDRQAVRLKAAGCPIGYVNRLQSKVIREWLDQREIGCWITRLNGPSDAPRAYAFLRVRSLATSVAA